MKLNNLGKVFFTVCGAALAVKVAEYVAESSNVETQADEPQQRLASAQELLSWISEPSCEFLARLAKRDDWNGFNQQVSDMPAVMAANHQQRCAMWELCRRS
jgi:hypothetical protein